VGICGSNTGWSILILTQEVDMTALEEILRKNPRVAKELESIRDVIETLNKLRDAGMARGPELAYGPYTGSPKVAGLKFPRKKVNSN
jgi:hypothetical protein